MTNRIIIGLLVLAFPFIFSEAKPTQKKQAIYIADPTIFRSNNLYYLYGTDDGAKTEKGFPVLVSKDLISWQKPRQNGGYVLTKGSQTFGTTGFWAPQVFSYNNKFYMLYTANENIALAESNSPYGPFTQKNVGSLPSNTKQIDPFLFFDEDEKKYLFHVRLGGGNKIFVAEFKDDFSGIKPETLKECITAEGGWEDTKRIPAPPIAEGPTVIKHNGTYYLFYSANDYRNIDYAVGYATSRSPLGPWKKYEKNPIINRKLVGHNGTGHGDVFKDKAGNYNYVFHIHHNDSTANPRQALIIGLRFVKNPDTGIDDVLADKKTLRIPYLVSPSK